uniref:Uncharacterized protein n=1 Tax=Rhizophora mucronata TaxID=61149 RepID=A0A2P2J340_RHIMU
MTFCLENSADIDNLLSC